MNRLHLILISLLGVASAFAAGTVHRPQHNFLFIIDSSISMEQRKPAAIKLVRDVITSGFDGQIDAGDSIDIWTYDTENNLRGYPPQIWSSTNAARIIESATQYLEGYRFKGRSDFANVATDLNILVPQTKSLLIVIITDGEQPFAGFHLDLEINGYLAKKGRIGTQAKDPLLVSLAAINGAIRTWTAYFGQGEIALASLPGRKVKATVATAQQPETIQKAKPVAKPTLKEPVVKLDASPSAAFSTFNFPPGTRFNPLDAPAVPVTKSEKPLELSKSRSAVKSNLGKAGGDLVTTAAPGTATNATRSTNSAQMVAAAPPTSAPTNSTTSLASRTNAVATVASVSSSAPPSGQSPLSNERANLKSSHQNSSHSVPVSAHGAIRQAIYVSALTGVGCVMAGIYLLYRKFRRPTQSIISRSLLQR